MSLIQTSQSMKFLVLMIALAPSSLKAEVPTHLWSSSQEHCQIRRTLELASGQTEEPRECTGVDLFARPFADLPEHENFIRLLCEHPRKFCLSVQDLSRRSPEGALSDSECRPPVSALIQASDSPLEQQSLIQSLAPDDLRLADEKLLRSFGNAQKALQKLLTDPQLSIPSGMTSFLGQVRLATAKEVEELGICGVSREGTSDPEGLPLGVFQAMASPSGQIIVCPLTSLFLNESALTFTLLHEMAHYLDACLTGSRLLIESTPPNCAIPTLSQLEKIPVDQRPSIPAFQSLERDWKWKIRTQSLESCFSDAGIKRGTDDIRTLNITAEILQNAGITRKDLNQKIGCLGDIGHRASKKLSGLPEDGVLNSCDPSFFKDFNLALLQQVKEAGLATSPRSQSWMKKTKKNLVRMSARPKENQFNEAFSDWIASKAFPHSTPPISPSDSPAQSRRDWINGMTLLCSEEADRTQKGEAHLHNHHRIEWVMAQPELRRWVGCQDSRTPSHRIRRAQARCADPLFADSPLSGNPRKSSP